MNMASINWKNTFEEIKDHHDSAYREIAEGTKLEENQDLHNALERYKRGIEIMEEALGIPVECPESPDETWHEAQTMIDNMKRTKGEVRSRMELRTLPSYQEAIEDVNLTATQRLRSFTEIIQALKNDTHQTHSVNVIYRLERVKMYEVSGDVSQVGDTHDLVIGYIERDGSSTFITFLQVDEWVYPLIPNVSPCYRTEWGAYLFPDLLSPAQNASIGIVIPEDCDAQVFSILEDILKNVVGEVPVWATPRTRSISGAISQGIVTGANYISLGLMKSADKAGDILNYTTPKLIDHMAPAAHAQPIPSGVQKGLQVAQCATGVAANLTGFLASKISSATCALGKYLAPHIERQGTKMLASGFHMSETEASEKMSGVMSVAAGAVEGFSIVYQSLETSAAALGRNLTDNTVKVVEHRYGQPSGQLTSDTLHTVGNLVAVSQHVSHLHPKGLVKSTAKETGKALVRPGPSRHS